NGVNELGREIALRDQAEEGAFGISVREHDAGPDFRAVFKHYASHSSIARIDLLNWCTGADFGAEGSGRFGHGTGDGAHAAHHVAVEALLLVLAAAEQVEKQAECGAGLVGASVFAVDIVSEKQRFYFFGFVVAVEEVTEAASQERDQLRDFGAGDSAKAFARAEQVSPSVERLGAGFGRRLEKKWLQIASQFLEAIVDADESFSVFGRNLAEFFDHLLARRPPGNETAVRERNLERGIARHHAESMIREMVVADDFRAEHAGDVGSRGSSAAGSDFFGDAASADHVAPFQDEGGVSGASEIGGSGQAVVAGANDGRVINRFGAVQHAPDLWS